MLRWLPPVDGSESNVLTALRSVLKVEGLEARTLLSTGTGLDQLYDVIINDPGLNRRLPQAEIRAGADAADGMNQIIVEAIRTTGLANDGVLQTADVRDLNAYIRANHLARFTELHGDDEDGAETGFHLVQNDGATTRLFGKNAVDTVADGLYHIGFEIRNDRFVNEDGDANARVEQVGVWLNHLLRADLADGSLANPNADPYARGTTGTGLDNLVGIIASDVGLDRKIATSEITAGARAADELNRLILEAIRATGVANDGTINAADVRDLNAYIRANHLARFTELHGDDEDGVETGFHLVQNDGARTRLFAKNAVDTVADGLYHIGFEIRNDRFVNEDGDANARVETVAFWLESLLRADLGNGSLANPDVDAYARGTTGTGLDRLVSIVASDEGLNRKIATSEITAGGRAADGLNRLIVDAIRATGVGKDKVIDWIDVLVVGRHIRQNHLAEFTALHGNDEGNVETGFHRVQGDGATSRLFGKNAVNTIADGLYHIGFEVRNGRFVNEDGDANARVEDVAYWLDQLLRDDLAAGRL